MCLYGQLQVATWQCVRVKVHPRGCGMRSMKTAMMYNLYFLSESVSCFDSALNGKNARVTGFCQSSAWSQHNSATAITWYHVVSRGSLGAVQVH
jgi:hypothetical protein